MSNLQQIQNHIMHFFGRLKPEYSKIMLVPPHIYEEHKRLYKKNPVNQIINNRRLCDSGCQRSLSKYINITIDSFASTKDKINSSVSDDVILTVAQNLAFQYKNTQDLNDFKQDLDSFKELLSQENIPKELESLLTFLHTEIENVTKRMKDVSSTITRSIAKEFVKNNKKPRHNDIKVIINTIKPVAKSILNVAEHIYNIEDQRAH